MEPGLAACGSEALASLTLEDQECTICMEAISQETHLPCQCRLRYCQPCWNKALASSFRQIGQARCPSCRSLVRVDFDADNDRLSFTPEHVDMTLARQAEIIQRIREEFQQLIEAGQSSRTDESYQRYVLAHAGWATIQSIDRERQSTLNRLRLQAMPAQLKILRRYSEDNRKLSDIRNDARATLANIPIAELRDLMQSVNIDIQDCIERSNLLDRLIERGNMTTICAEWVLRKFPAPNCVCGSALRRYNGIERLKLMLRGSVPDMSDEEIQFRIESFSGDGGALCDICVASIPVKVESFVWTCENRYGTILHARSNDICDACFVQHIFTEQPLPSYASI